MPVNAVAWYCRACGRTLRRLATTCTCGSRNLAPISSAHEVAAASVLYMLAIPYETADKSLREAAAKLGHAAARQPGPSLRKGKDL